MSEFTIVGGGAWGTALAVHLGRGAGRVRLWMQEPELVTRMIERRDNPTYLPGVRIPDSVVPSAELSAALHGAEIVLCVVPSIHARAVYRRMAPFLVADAALVVATKGIEEGSLEYTTDNQHLGEQPHTLLAINQQQNQAKDQ